MPDADGGHVEIPNTRKSHISVGSYIYKYFNDLMWSLPFFCDLTDQQAEQVSRLIRSLSTNADATITLPKDSPPQIFILTSLFSIIYETTENGGTVERCTLRALECVNDLLLVDVVDPKVVIRSVEACEWLLIDRDAFLNFLSQSPALIPKLFYSLHLHIKNSQENLLRDLLERQARFIQQEREQYLQLMQVPILAGETNSFEQALKVSLEAICTHLGWSLGHAYIVKKNGTVQIISSAQWHVPGPEHFDQFRISTEATIFAPGEGMAGKVFESGKPLQVFEFEEMEDSLRARDGKVENLRGALCLPVLHHAEVVAILEFFTTQKVQPNPALLEMLSAAIASLGLVLERKQYEEQLHHHAFHDQLTGLPNRTLFLDHLSLSIVRRKRRRNHQFGIVYLDMDHFKQINDTLGHLFGDRMLSEIGRRIQSTLRATDTVARFGGDEFTILLDDIGEVSNVAHTIDRIRKEIEKPIRLGDSDIFPSVSMGIVLSTRENLEADQMLNEADIAMYHAKAKGRGCYVIFDPAMKQKAGQIQQLEVDLLEAMTRNQLRLFYQPIIELETGRVVGFEAFLRWNHPSRGLLTAAEFLPLAMETGRILQISQWALHQSCRQLKIWKRMSSEHARLTLTVNLTTKYLAQPELADEILQLVRDYELEPGRLRVEITEGQIINGPKTLSETIQELRRHEVHVEIDDFGTGYSSLSSLSKIKVDSIKIDHSLICLLDETTLHHGIIKAVIGLGRNLDLQVVAEGVETAEQVDFLRASHCEFAQGYYFSKPLEADAATRLIRGNPRLDREKSGDKARLQIFDIFQNMTAAELDEIAQVAREQTVAAGSRVIWEGQCGAPRFTCSKKVPWRSPRDPEQMHESWQNWRPRHFSGKERCWTRKKSGQPTSGP